MRKHMCTVCGGKYDIVEIRTTKPCMCIHCWVKFKYLRKKGIDHDDLLKELYIRMKDIKDNWSNDIPIEIIGTGEFKCRRTWFSVALISVEMIILHFTAVCNVRMFDEYSRWHNYSESTDLKTREIIVPEDITRMDLLLDAYIEGVRIARGME